MSLASRIITALVGLGLIVFFWPFGSGDEAITAVEQRPSKRLFTKPIAPARKGDAAKEGQAAQATKTGAPEESAHAIPVPGEPQSQSLRPKLYYRVVVRDGGTIEANGIVITLGGIAARKASAQCKDSDGKDWACGARARVALMRLIHGRAVTCQVPPSSKQKSLTARCTVGGSDLSTWMVAQGWAEPTAPKEPALALAATAARKRRIGIWR
jgi:endonuclease YncB( thermonuclease family)